MNKYILTILVLMLYTSSAVAEMAWIVAPGPSKVGFKVKHLVFMDVEGKFKRFEGKVISDKDNSLEDAQIEARILVDSIYTGIDDRDKHLIGEDFFYNEKYPEIIFKSTKVVKAKDGICYIIIGDLTIRGITQQIELMAKCKNMRLLANGKTRMDLEASGLINRFDYDLHWNELIETGRAIVGADVHLVLDLALLSDPGSAAQVASASN